MQKQAKGWRVATDPKVSAVFVGGAFGPVVHPAPCLLRLAQARREATYPREVRLRRRYYGVGYRKELRGAYRERICAGLTETDLRGSYRKRTCSNAVVETMRNETCNKKTPLCGEFLGAC